MKKHKILRHIFCWVICGVLYCGLEILWRGYTHWTMGVLAAVLCVPLDLANEFFDWNLGLLWQAVSGGLIITAAEFIAGIVLNLWLKLDIWDYTNLRFNLLGQVCPQFTILWIFLSAVMIPIFDALEWKMCGGEKPRYKIV